MGRLPEHPAGNLACIAKSGGAHAPGSCGLAFIAANLGALEILGLAANGARYGAATVHFYWIGAEPRWCSWASRRVNLFAMALVIRLLLGWPIPVSIVLAAAIVLVYITLGGLSSAIYNEVLQFLVILAWALLRPLRAEDLNQSEEEKS
jgi:Na+(H+)/acetate symporter ActP